MVYSAMKVEPSVQWLHKWLFLALSERKEELGTSLKVTNALDVVRLREELTFWGGLCRCFWLTSKFSAAVFQSAIKLMRIWVASVLPSLPLFRILTWGRELLIVMTSPLLSQGGEGGRKLLRTEKFCCLVAPLQ